MKVRNMVSPNGNEVPNQFIIEYKKRVIFQSYDSIIAIKDLNTYKVVLGKDWNASRTTSKYRSMFLNETTKETQKKLDEGIYTLNKKL